MVPVAALACCVAFALAWYMPGPFAVVSTMSIVVATVRASDIARTLPTAMPRRRFLLTLLFLERHPLDAPRPQVQLAPKWRVARGAALLTLCLGLNLASRAARPWELCPYLHDLLLALELGLGYLGSVELITPLARRLGLTELSIHVDGLAPGFLWSRSLRRFWGQNWNRPTSGMLRRGVFDAVGGRRRLTLAVLATFFVSGLFHGPSLALAAGGALRPACLWLAALGTAWFVVHGLGCLLEGALNRGRGRRWVGRAVFYATFLVTVPCYPAPFFIALGLHGRTIDEATPVILLRWAGLV
jgi:hypothetical protein